MSQAGMPLPDRDQTSDAIDAGTAIGAVALTVADLERSRAFYERVLGLRARPKDDGIGFGVDGGPDLVVVGADGAAPALDGRVTGLFHLAILVPSRPQLAQALVRLATARWPLSGASDHLVSEALYLQDPDGNGIEIYRDRPREQWRRDLDGSIQMATLALDLDDLLAEAGNGVAASGGSGFAAGTRIGHVHLQVSDLAKAERFYHDLLGFGVTVRGYPGALFVSAGGYHHHLGLNTWNSAGAQPAASGAIGLRWFEIVLPDDQSLAEVLGRLAAGGVRTRPAGLDDMTLVDDPSGITVALRRA